MPRLGTIDPALGGQLALELVAAPGWVILMSCLLAGWLMGTLSWLVAAGRDTISQIFFVAYFLGWATAGNVIGGTLFAVLIRYSLVVGGTEDQEGGLRPPEEGRRAPTEGTRSQSSVV